ncbi:RNA polymerase recycling motor HelD [Liquorilactobacillus mali]|uniref:RNA polymerase recycling motor HelD n=1 Tax=Liquorilactobacillus mali TaxID=1618 RepID=UPI002350B71C|nr:RNA polymerase recycling motor HelD [Liquorilactobacillus mali]MDC7953491.1 AAA family ATPase [Liquorilactobacillus mali]
MNSDIKAKEQRRMDDVVGKIKTAEKKHHKEIESVKKDSQAIKKDFSNNLRIKTESYSGIFETAMTVRQQQQLLQERENNWKLAARRLDVLAKLEKKPYFARIDFKEKGEQKTESVYIGLGSFSDRPDNFLIYDWRAPISSVYYDGGIGEISYETPDGMQKVDVKLKRQFLVNDAKIQTVFDTDEAVGDQMLLDVLDDSSDTKMKSIVTTIQKEQNQIIRETKAQLLFVQGAAGSGKTSAVLQRVAYLLYRFRGNLTSSQVILFSPNQLFNDYVDQVLPDLGEQNMIQMTYYQYAQRRLPKLKVETLQQRFERVETAEEKKIQGLKDSLQFFNATTTYGNFLENKGMRFKDIRFRGDTFFDKEHIEKIYYSFNENYHLRNRLEATKERLLKQLGRRVDKASKEEWVEKAVQELSPEELTQLYGDRARDFGDGDAELHFLTKRYVTGQYRQIQRDIQRNRFLNINAQYIHFLNSIPDLLNIQQAGITEEQWKKEIERVITAIKEKKMLMEDVSPYLYLYDLITGKRGELDIRHVFIDEIQDYTPYQLACLKASFPRARFTVLGDLNQAIFTKKESYILLEEMSKLFPKDGIKVVQLTKSYRSTKQITEFTKQVLLSGASVEAFERKGELPELQVFSDEEQMIQKVMEQLQSNDKEKLTTAIIGKTLAQCQKLTDELHSRGVNITLIKTENQRLAAGNIIVPAFLAKGLEFDAVIMWDASEKNYYDEDERQLVYTICSRAMHRLNIVALNELSTLFERISSDSYKLIED